MNATLMLSNIALYSLQSAGLILAGLLLVRLLRLARALVFLQLLLLAALSLPLLQRWTQPVIAVERVAAERIALPVTALERVNGPVPLDWMVVTLWVLGLGVLGRLAWLAVGLIRLRSLRRYAAPAEDGVAISTEIAGPVTFGFWRPIVLVPPSVMEMAAEAREAILAHERAHIRRRDWIFALLEELVLCGLWFHPAMWLLIGQIRLAREQVVDLEACRVAVSREVYVDALLTIADARMQPYFAPAPPFLRRRQLASRIQSLVVEVPMSRFRLVASYGAAVAGTVALAVALMVAFPLRGAPQLVQAPPRLVNIEGAELVFSTPPYYPIAAERANVEGSVSVELTLAPNGEVADARVVSGAQELRKAALDAVLNWQFKPGPSAARVSIEFQMSNRAPNRVESRVVAVEIADDIPGFLAETLRARLTPFVGRPASGEIYSIVKRVDPALTLRVENISHGDIVEMKFRVERMDRRPLSVAVPGRMQVGGVAQAENLIYKPTPEYPALARQARIQGTVRFRIGIDRAGSVIAVETVAGHPLLIPAAAEAIRHYRYKPTLLNGQAVEVSTEVDVNFTL